MIPIELSLKDRTVVSALEEQGFRYAYQFRGKGSEPDWANCTLEEFQGWEIQSRPMFKVTHLSSGHVWVASIKAVTPRDVSQVKLAIHRAIALHFDDLIE